MYFGGKALEPLGEALGPTAFKAFQGVCGGAVDRVSGIISGLATGGSG